MCDRGGLPQLPQRLPQVIARTDGAGAMAGSGTLEDSYRELSTQAFCLIPLTQKLFHAPLYVLSPAILGRGGLEPDASALPLTRHQACFLRAIVVA